MKVAKLDVLLKLTSKVVNIFMTRTDDFYTEKFDPIGFKHKRPNAKNPLL